MGREYLKQQKARVNRRYVPVNCNGGLVILKRAIDKVSWLHLSPQGTMEPQKKAILYDIRS